MAEKSSFKKYLVRSLKYLLYLLVVLALIVALFSLLSQKKFDFFNLFRPGTGWQMALFLIVISIIYPFFGYISKRITLNREFSQERSKIVELFERYNYRVECELDGNISFCHKSGFIRLLRSYEDRIIVTPEENTIKLEGARRDVMRIARTIEYMLSKEENSGGVV